MESWRKNAGLSLFIALLTVGLIASQMVPASASDREETTQLVEKARLTLNNFMRDSDSGIFHVLLKRAQGVLIAPRLLKRDIVVGASGCNAVFLVRDRTSGKWSEPAFYTIREPSFGLRIIGEDSEVILLVMTDRGMRSFLGNRVRLGWDIDIAAGPVEMGAGVTTSNPNADILTFSRSKELYGGVFLDGATVSIRGDLNNAYYDKKGVSPTVILMRHDVTNLQAMNLVEDVAKWAANKSASLE